MKQEIQKAIEALKFYSIDKKNRYDILIDNYNSNKDKIAINETMLEVIAKKGDYKQKEKINFDKKYSIRNGEVYRRSDNALLLWFDLSKIIYQKDVINYYCYIDNKKKELSKNAWLVINYLNQSNN